MEYLAGSYDVIVIGAGHAGIEACLASARLGCKTAVFTINLDWVGNMPCNPSIGGTSKGHLVREIDALGGEMGKMADKYTLQSRMLNLGKGPAVHSLRAQIDRREYSQGMKHTLELEDNLDIRQGEIVDLYRLPDGNWQVKTKLEALFNAKAVIIATGTFLGGRVYIGDVSYESGPDGMFPATELSKALKKLDIPLRRFKTGTPSRVNRKSIDFTNLEEQDGDEETVPFSFETEEAPKNKVCCHITYSNEKTKQIILDNLDRSPMYSGKIEGKGPRYCPSFEDKIVRFKDKERHQLFIEPCGLETEEMYLQGLSSSLPEDVQLAFIHTIPGLEHAQVMRTAYAIEYDCVDPTALNATLEFNSIAGLYGAGQFNGSSGYEEAAAQGLVLMDVTPLTLSIETLGGVATPLITRNSMIPTRKSQIFTTARPMQTSVEINVLQGERHFARDNKSLGKFKLNGIRASFSSKPQIEVTFDIDVNGVVKVSAKDLGTGREQNITITGSTNLSENEIQRAMADAAAYEAEDSRRKERLDLHNQAEVLAYKVDEALSKCKKELDKDEKNRIKADVANLRRCLRKDKPEKMNETEEANLRQAKQQLEASANHLMMLYTSEQSSNDPNSTL